MTAPTPIPLDLDPSAALVDASARARLSASSARPVLWLFLVGGLAATASLFLGPASMDRTQVAGICAAAWGLAVILCFAPGRLPRWMIHVFLACGTVLVEWVTLATGDPSSLYPIMYFLVATCAFCFLSKAEAAAQGMFIAIAYAVGLALSPAVAGSNGLRAGAFALALVVGGTFIGTLRTKQDRLMAELRSVSRADPVSGLQDRRGFDEAIANELERVRRSGSRFGLIVGTIDDYESVPRADRRAVLAAAGAAIVSAKREIDAGARIDDCEFAVLATYTDERGADMLAERICSLLSASPGVRATMSIGVVSHPRHGATADILLSAARAARAEAADLGGDRSLVALSSADSIAARLNAEVNVVPLT
jgi:diguanylate cyclase (GGDEF)-like protein